MVEVTISLYSIKQLLSKKKLIHLILKNYVKLNIEIMSSRAWRHVNRNVETSKMELDIM